MITLITFIHDRWNTYTQCGCQALYHGPLKAWQPIRRAKPAVLAIADVNADSGSPRTNPRWCLHHWTHQLRMAMHQPTHHLPMFMRRHQESPLRTQTLLRLQRISSMSEVTLSLTSRWTRTWRNNLRKLCRVMTPIPWNRMTNPVIPMKQCHVVRNLGKRHPPQRLLHQRSFYQNLTVSRTALNNLYGFP